MAISLRSRKRAQRQTRPQPVLPICVRCRQRKRRCDRAPPRCSASIRTDSCCIIADPISKAEYPREYIGSLEEKERQLLIEVRHRNVSATIGVDEASLDRPSTSGHIANDEASLLNVPARNEDSHAFGFVRSVMSNTEPTEISMERTAEACKQMEPNQLPPLSEATKLLDNFFKRFQIHHSFLLRQDVRVAFQRIYHQGTHVADTPVDRFRMFLIFAVSAITWYRSGLGSDHPYGFYLAAQEFLPEVLLVGSIEAIENLLLIARFGMYHRCGVSLWEASRLCLRQCIEWGLHEPPTVPLEPLEEQRRRRIFWECYLLDRNSTGFLGRPFALSDTDIRVELPVDADDELIQQSGAPSLAAIPDSQPNKPTELSVFIFFIRLRRITSRIHFSFYAGRSAAQQMQNPAGVAASASPQVYRKLNEFEKELIQWRLSAPCFESPESLYERPEWYDFLWQRDRLSLIRGAIHNSPKINNSPPKDLLVICLDAATRVVKLFFGMLKSHEITWTKGYLQVIFTAVLSIFYCMSLEAHKLAGGTATDYSREALFLYGDMLRLFRARHSDSNDFSFVFRAIQQKFLQGTDISGEDLEIFGPMYSESGQQLCSSARQSPDPNERHGSGGVQNFADLYTHAPEADAPYTEPLHPEGSTYCEGETSHLGAGDMDSIDWLSFSDNMLGSLDAEFLYESWAFPGEFGFWDGQPQ